MEQPGMLPSGDFPVRGCRGQIRAYIKRERRNTPCSRSVFSTECAGRIREHTPHYGKEENTPLKTQYKILALVLALLCLRAFPVPRFWQRRRRMVNSRKRRKPAKKRRRKRPQKSRR